MARTASRLKVTAVEVKDVLGARHFAIEPGRITVLAGRNGSGKSTALAAVQAALGGGNLARLARVDQAGADVDPEVVLILEGDDAEAYRVEKSNKTVRVRARVGETAAFEDVPKPAEWLKSLYDPTGANPVAFLTAKDQDRALMLLEALPLKLDETELDRILGEFKQHVPPLPERLHPLERVQLVRDAVFRARTGVNRDHRGKADAADQTRRSAPAKAPDDPKAEIEALDAQAAALSAAVAREEAEAAAAEAAAVQQAEAAYRLEEERISGEFRTEAQKLRRAFDQEAAEIRAEAERRIAALKDETDASVRRLQNAGEEGIAGAEVLATHAKDEARRVREAARFRTEATKRDLGAVRERLSALRVQAEDSARARALHQQAEAFDREAEQLKAESDRMTRCLDGLDAFARRLAEDLPIPGLEIAGREIKVHGIPFEQLNTQARVDIAVRVACLRSRGSRLPLVFVDGAEALDRDHFDELVSRLAAEGVQAFVARVTDHDLQVEAIGEAVTT